MDKLRKIGLWVWNNKERLAFGLLAIILTVQVYRVMSQEIEQPPLPTPKPGEPKEYVVEPPPAPPESDNYSSLVERNPFSYYSSVMGAGSQGTDGEDNIQLLDIQRAPDGGYAARIYTKAAKWYKEGESFESYVLLRIDPEQQLVEVRSDKTGTTLTLRMQP